MTEWVRALPIQSQRRQAKSAMSPVNSHFIPEERINSLNSTEIRADRRVTVAAARSPALLPI